jgi:ABC-type nitrate/sulfonate/bicarbonate transport system permease component
MKRTLGIVFLGLLWEGLSRVLQAPIFPPLSVILRCLWGLLGTGELWGHLGTSVTYVLAGFALAMAAGVLAGVLVATSRRASDVLMPVIDLMRPVAAITIFPLIILALGLGFWAKCVVIAWTAWPAVLLNTAQSLRTVDIEVTNAARVFGASERQVLWHIRLPLSMAGILTGCRIGLSASWVALIAAEMLGSTRGLGFINLLYAQTFQFPEMYATVILIACLGLLMNVFLAALQNLFEYQEIHYESPFLAYLDRAFGATLGHAGHGSMPAQGCAGDPRPDR